jgi:hypothetical protein
MALESKSTSDNKGGGSNLFDEGARVHSQPAFAGILEVLKGREPT